MSTPATTQLQGFRTGAFQLPSEYVAMPMTINFTNDATFIKDFVQEQQNLRIPFIQSVYIDNSADANTLTLTINDGIGQVIKVKGNTQGIYPIFAQEGALRVTVTSTQAGVSKTLIFLSMPVAPLQWATA